jgi:hypothetical protein
MLTDSDLMADFDDPELAEIARMVLESVRSSGARGQEFLKEAEAAVAAAAGHDPSTATYKRYIWHSLKLKRLAECQRKNAENAERQFERLRGVARGFRHP